MERGWWTKFTLLVLCAFFGLTTIYPSFTKRNLEEAAWWPFGTQKINLGLDLQGGLYMVLGVDFNKVFAEYLERQGAALEAQLKEKGIAGVKVTPQENTYASGDPRVTISVGPGTHDTVYKILKEDFYQLRFTGDTPNSIEVGLAHDHRGDVRERTIEQSIEVIRNRIDEFGVSEPSITSQGIDRVVVELPGVKDVERAKGLIGKTARLEFKIVNDEHQWGAEASLAGLIEKLENDNNFKYEKGKMKFSEYIEGINKFARGKIPAGHEIGFERVKGVGGEMLDRIPYLLTSVARVTGDDLADASVGVDPQSRRPMVLFGMNPKGANTLGKVTEENKGKRMAIVLDNIVMSAPVIQSRITDRGQITLGQGPQDKVLQEATDLSVVLRAGALPAQLEELEQRVVGPSLGADSIRLGTRAGVIGALMVFLFIGVFYRLSGVIAVASLALNVTFVFAILVAMEATLTLPGIAALALTVGIAVDSNVVIYERIREELRAGKSVHSAVEAGFQKAFRTILDANLTNAGAALVLLNFGTGPIKGFAVTMLVGIITTLFTAVFVCRLFFDLYLRRLEMRRSRALSI